MFRTALDARHTATDRAGAQPSHLELRGKYLQLRSPSFARKAERAQESNVIYHKEFLHLVHCNDSGLLMRVLQVPFTMLSSAHVPNMETKGPKPVSRWGNVIALGTKRTVSEQNNRSSLVFDIPQSI
jgi:hypothetical protein